MKTYILLIVLMSFTTVFTQEAININLPQNENTKTAKEYISVNDFPKNKYLRPTYPLTPMNTDLVKDTIVSVICIDGGYFRISGQEILFQPFKAPADMKILKIGYFCHDNSTNTPVEVKIVKVNWTEEQLLNAPELHRGYYEATGNGINDITAFVDNPDRTGNWTSIQSGETEPFSEDIWSDSGIGYIFTPTEYLGDVQWIETSKLGFEPFVSCGEIFGVSFKNTSPNMGQDFISFNICYSDLSMWKFYANGRFEPGIDIGWWNRIGYTLEIYLIVDVLSNSPPQINNFTKVGSSIGSEQREIFANITSTRVDNILVSNINYSTNNGSVWNVINMEFLGNETYHGFIPGFSQYTEVMYYISATDTTGLSCGGTVNSMTIEYVNFVPSGASTLVVFNGYSDIKGYPQSYYFGSGDWPNSYTTLTFDHDTWVYGPLSAELVNDYTNIIEICSDGPNDINNNAIRTWLEGNGSHNYMLAGDEWLGTQTSWRDTSYEMGSFQYDILGIKADHNDINYATGEDQNLPSVVYPQSATLLGGDLYDLYNKVTADSGWTSPMRYDPHYEIGVANWLDGVDFESDVEVDIKGFAVDSTTIYDIGGHRTLPAGNKIAFFAFDPLSLNSDSENQIEYYWYGFTLAALQVRALDWFGIPVGVGHKNSGFIPENFSLSQNYPNPFNPSTKISWQSPVGGWQALKVFDVLGNEIATLVDEYRSAGRYEVDFKSSVGSLQLASGVYFYRLEAGSYIKTKKMILAK